MKEKMKADNPRSYLLSLATPAEGEILSPTIVNQFLEITLTGPAGISFPNF